MSAHSNVWTRFFNGFRKPLHANTGAWKLVGVVKVEAEPTPKQ